MPQDSVLENIFKNNKGEVSQKANSEQVADSGLLKMTQDLLPKFGDIWNRHNLVTLKRQSVSRILYLDNLYKKMIGSPGVICEFGVQWGATLSQLINLRGIYEPYNHSRKIYGFDTFEGFPTIDEKDGKNSLVGDYATQKDYELTLNEILTIHESLSPLPHLKKFDLIKGDASLTIDAWLEENPHLLISMAFFDMDLYKPTYDVLKKILPRLFKGSILVFDELNCPAWPGETLALNEVLNINNLTLQHDPNQPYCAWTIYGK